MNSRINTGSSNGEKSIYIKIKTVKISKKCGSHTYKKMDRYKILYNFNRTEYAFPEKETVFSLFEQQAEKYPNNVALIYHGQKLTYKDFNEKSNQLARKLRKMGVQGDSIVAIITEPSFDMAIGIMGILKAGGAYLPIDPSYPQDRIEYMLQDSGVSTVITQSHLNISFIEKQRCIFLDQLDLDQEEKSNLENIIHTRNLVYIIYTSGTTGKPKGVMVEHRSVVNTLYYRKQEYKLTPEDTAMEFFSFAFDGFVTIFFTPLISGSKVVILGKDEINDVEKIKHIIVKNRVTNIISVPALYGMLVECLTKEEMQTLKIVTLAGDTIPEKLVKDSYDKSKTTEISVEYGVTEAAVMSTIYRHQQKDKKIKIGKPIGNTKILLLDERLRLVPIGTPGELCIGGIGLARGYINKPEMTEQKFIINPFFPQERLYRSGDLAKWLPDGNLIFLGRKDSQVKVRGFRIEVSEIENRLLEYEGILEAAVVALSNKDGSRYLCAYYVSDIKIDVEQLKEFMAKQLPVYMIPQFIIEICGMPLTPNGKIDRKALPDPWSSNEKSDYVEPKTHIEKTLINIWEQVLGVKRLGLTDNFFHLGGDSIKAMQITSRLFSAGFKLKVKDLVNNPRPEAMIPYIKNIKPKHQNNEESGQVPLTPIQKWFFANNFEDRQHWNQALCVLNKKRFDESKLDAAVMHVVRHHDALRTVFLEEDSKVVQYIKLSTEVACKLEFFDCSEAMEYEATVNEKMNALQKNFVLSEGLLVQFALFRTCDGDQLFIIAHHLIVDSVSFRIILEDLQNAYSLLEKGQEVALSDKTTSYKEWAVQLNKIANDTCITSQRDYWAKILNCDYGIFQEDYSIVEDLFKDSHTATIGLKKSETHALVNLANRAYNTKTNDLLLAALVITLQEYTGKQDVLVHMEGHGREDLFDELDITRTVGWFTSTFPAVFTIQENLALGKVITIVKECMRNIPQNGIGYGILNYLTEENCWEAKSEKPEINFNFLGQMDNNQSDKLLTMKEIDVLSCISGNAKRTSKLDIYGFIQQDKLILHMNYNKNQFNKDTMDNFFTSLKNKLLEIINHCTSFEYTEFTKSDFNLSNFSEDSFDVIKRNLKQHIRLNNIKDIYSLSPMQEGMLYSGLYQQNNDAYFQQMMINLKGQIDVGYIEKAFQLLVKKHDVLRTLFIWDEIPQPIQVVLKDRPVKLGFEDISHLSQVDNAHYIKAMLQADREETFDLHEQPLMRMKLVKEEAKAYILLISFHHIIMDGWCFGLIFDDFLHIISMLKIDSQIEMHSVSPYSNYIWWLSSFQKEAAQLYWKNYLLGYTRPTNISRGKGKAGLGNGIKESCMRIDESLGTSIIAFARENDTTPNTIFQSVWGLFLQKYLMCSDVVFGYVVSGRPPEIEDVEKMTGLFINTVPLRVKLEENSTYIDVLRQVREDNINAKPYENLSLAEIQSSSDVKRGLFDHIMIYENFPVGQTIHDKKLAEKTGFEITGIEVYEKTEYDFTVTITPQEKSFEILFQYVEEEFGGSLIDCIGKLFINMLHTFIAQSHTSICEINWTSNGEEVTISDSNHIIMDYNRDVGIKELFEQAAIMYPQNTAVRFGDTEITYQELDSRSNRLARLLLKKKVVSDNLVGLILYPSIEMMVCILAVIKSGGAYLPIEPDLPASRIQYMLKDSHVRSIICSSETSERCPKQEDIINIEREYLEDIDDKAIGLKTKPDALAYVIYTSGSTGSPKGVQVEHRQLTAYIHSFYEYFTVTDQDVFLQQASYSFDAFVEEMYPVLLKGGTVAVLPRAIAKDMQDIRDYAEQYKVTMISVSPLLLNALDKMKNIESIHTYISGGDVLKREYIQHLLARGRVVNTYGPTEATVCCAYYTCKKDDILIPIGKPIANYEVYIMNENKAPQPVLLPGEIYIGGEGVTRGYINNEELTKEKFIQHPYTQNARLYRSGDYGRFLPDGNIEFLGRMDSQVKIRGYRIETTEIESKLLEHRDIYAAIVVLRKGKDDEDYLCAYFTSCKQIGANTLRNHLEAILPVFMIPAYFIRLEKIPVNTSGKVNQGALPEPYLLLNTGEEYVEPTTPNEKTLVKVLQNVLGIDRVSVNDRFFNLGGDSLKAIRVVSSLKEYKVNLKLKLLMSNLSIKELASEFEYQQDKLQHISVEGEVQLHPYHISLFQDIFKNNFESSAHWNTSGMFFSTDRFILDIVKTVVNKLVVYHDALRTVFYRENGVVKQYVKSANGYQADVVFVDLIGIKEELHERILEEMLCIQQSFTLDKMFKVALFRADDGDYIYFTGNHLITDAFSDDILYEDFFIGYRQAMNQQKIVFFEKSDSYKKWIEKLYTYSSSSQLCEERDYWKDIVSSSAATINKDFSCRVEQTLENVADLSSVLLDEANTDLLKRVAFKNNISIFAILLSAWSITVYKLTGASKTRVLCVNNGRNGFDDMVDVSRTIGSFMFTYPQLLDLRDADNPSKQLAYTSGIIRSVPRQGFGFEILKHLTPSAQKDGEMFNLPEGEKDTFFNYLGEFSEDRALSGSDTDTQIKPVYLIGDVNINRSKAAKWTSDFNIFLSMIQNRLSVRFQYSMAEYKKTTVEDVIAEFIQNIQYYIQNEGG